MAEVSGLSANSALRAYNRVLDNNKKISATVANDIQAPQNILRAGDNIDVVGKSNSSGSTASFATVFDKLVTKPFEQIKSTTRQMVRVAEEPDQLNQTNLIEIVAATNNAEITLKQIMTVRDKIVSAYMEILRMPI